MKFGKTLLDSSFPAWADQYFDYKSAKKLIKRILYAESGKTKSGLVIGTVTEEKELFRKFLVDELHKIDVFVKLKEDECISHFQKDLLKHARVLLNSPPNQPNAPDVFVALYDFIEELKRLQQYGQLNYTAFVKILKKYDKYTRSSLKGEFMPEVARHHFYTTSQFPQLLADSQTVVSQLLEKYPLLDPSTAKKLSKPLSIGKLLWKKQSQALYKIFEYMGAVSLKRAMGFLLALLVVESLLIQFAGQPIQASGCTVTRYMHESYRTELVDRVTDFIHNRITSKFWLLLCAIVFWVVDSRQGASSFAFVAAGFAVKSLAKNIIRSPRGFWLCTTYSAFYCGKGYSLPSGHSMVSTMALGFLLLKFKRPWIFIITALYEFVIFWNVQYIGTHTIADVVIGWTFALLCIVAYAYGEEQMYRRFARFRLRPKPKFVFLGCLLTILIVFALDTLVEIWPPGLQDVWQSNMETVCGLAKGSGGNRMYLHLNWSNTPLILGVLVGWLAQRRLLSGVLEKYSTAQRTLLAFGGVYVFLKIPAWLKTVLSAVAVYANQVSSAPPSSSFPLLSTILPGNWVVPLASGLETVHHSVLAFIAHNNITALFYHLFNLTMPIWVLFLAPYLFVFSMRLLGIKGTGAAAKQRDAPSLTRQNSMFFASPAGGLSIADYVAPSQEGSLPRS